MKIGSVAWGWTPVPEDMPSGDSLQRIADNVKKLGFDIVDYLSTYESLDSFFTPEKCREVGDYCKSIGIEVGGFVFQADHWNNPDENVQKKHMDYFRKCVDAAANIGASTISCIIPQPFGAKPNKTPSPSDKIALNLPAGYSWEKDWKLFTATLAKACDIAAEKGLRIALECFPGSLCSTPHAMLKAVEDVNRPNFGIQLDTAHLMNQRLDVETAVYMLGSKNIFNVHAKDSDGMTRGNLACGSGLVDYKALLRALANVGYNGNISIEVEFTTDPAYYMKQAFDHLKDCIAATR